MLFSTYNAEGQNKPVPVKKLFGVTLRTQAWLLLSDVEKIYAKAIFQQEATDWEPSRYGEEGIKQDGTPVITINASTGRTESTIVHELFHLKMKGQGFCAYEHRFPPGQMNKNNQNSIEWVNLILGDAILHWLFYPEMRRMGIDPDAEVRAELREVLQKSDFVGINPISAREARTMYWTKARLEIIDNELLDQIKKWYVKNEWLESLTTGEVLAESVLNSKPQTPQDVAAVYVKCLNALFEDRAKFELESWQEQKMGSYTQCVAIIKVFK